MKNIFEQYNLDEDWEKVSKLPIHPTKYLYTLDRALYMNINGKLKLISTRCFNEELHLFLKKYREYPELLPKVLDNFELSPEEKKIKLKKMQILLMPLETLEDFKNALQRATKELPLDKDLAYFGDGLMFVDKEEDLGKITDVFGGESPYAKKWLKKYKDIQWERGVIYNEQENIYENWGVKERSNDWEIWEKFYEKQYLFEYLLNLEIMAV